MSAESIQLQHADICGMGLKIQSGSGGGFEKNSRLNLYRWTIAITNVSVL